MRRLESLGGETRTFFYPSHRQKLFPQLSQTVSRKRFAVSWRLWERGLYIPTQIGMERAVIVRVAEAIHQV